MNANKYVLDSSAILAVFYREAGADLVHPLLEQSLVSTVNLAECLGKMVWRGIPAEQAKGALKDIAPKTVDLDQTIAFMTGELIAQTQPLGLSLGDRACLATAIHLHLEVVTADKAWSKLKLPVKIKVIR